MKGKKVLFLLIALIIVAAVSRFYNLNWGAPFYFHPDERNIASTVSQLQFPNQLNPHFFAYGSLPIYVIYFIGVIINLFLHVIDLQKAGARDLIFNVNFEQAIIISRFISACFSVLLIPLLFALAKKLKNEIAGWIAAFFTVFSTGFIQFAHFGTFEMWLTLQSVLLFYLTLRLLRDRNIKLIFLTALVFGIGVATKVSQFTLLVLPISAVVYYHLRGASRGVVLKKLRIAISDIFAFSFFAFSIFLITNPFVFLDINSFMGSMRYESDVALGTLPVFYTGEFKNSIPVIFQFLHIYPFLLNPFLTLFFIPALFYLVFVAIKRKKSEHLVLFSYFILLFLSQAFLYVRWIRYMVPTMPFMYLIISIALVDLWKYVKSKKQELGIRYLILPLFLIINILFALSYFVTAFFEPDTREAAAAWARVNIPAKSEIISEVYDLGIVPFNSAFSNITLFNFYELDNNSAEYSLLSLDQQLLFTDFIILPSQRISKVRLKDSINFPNGYVYYKELFSGMKGFRLVYKTPCDFFCRVVYLNDPIRAFEETANVFDRPTVYIFKRNEN